MPWAPSKWLRSQAQNSPTEVMSHDADMDNKRSEIYVYLKLSLFFHFSRWAHLKWIDEGHLTALGVCLRCLVGLCLMRRQESTPRTRLSVSTTTQHERICGHRVRTVMRCLITVQLWTLIATWFSQFTFQLRALAKKKNSHSPLFKPETCSISLSKY